MPTATMIEWLVLAAGTVAALGLVIVGGWALFGDRARGRRRCPKCWHDLTFTSGRRCSECGHEASSEAALHRTRRRPVPGLVAIIVAALVGAQAIDSVRTGGWTPYASDGLLITVIDRGGGGAADAEREFNRRDRAGRISTREWWRLLEAAADGTPRARPGDDRWASDHGPVVRDAWEVIRNANDATSAMRLEADRIVLELAARYPPEVTLESPAIWLPNEPVPIGVMVDEAWPVPLPIRLVASVVPAVASDLDPHREAWARFGTSIQPRAFTLRVPPPPPGDHEIAIDFVAARADPAAALSAEGGWIPEESWLPSPPTRAVTTIRIRDPRPGEAIAPRPGSPAQAQAQNLPADTGDPRPGQAGDSDTSPRARADAAPDGASDGAPDGVPSAYDDPQLTALIRAVFDAGAVQWQSGSLPVRIRVNRGATAAPEFSDVAVGLEVELRRNGVLGRTLLLWWMAGEITTGPNVWEVPFVDDAVLGPPAAESDVWTLVVKGREDLAMRVGGGRRWWSGQFERPIVVQTNRGAAPSRGWVAIPVPATDL